MLVWSRLVWVGLTPLSTMHVCLAAGVMRGMAYLVVCMIYGDIADERGE
jgi:hypothetical protein